MHSWEEKTVFSVGFVPRNYKTAQSGELKEYGGVERTTTEYYGIQRNSGGSQIQWSVQSEEDDSVSDSELWTTVTSYIKVNKFDHKIQTPSY
jgi:hypothetical protein